MICVDNTFLGLILYPTARPPDDPTTGKPIARLEDRLNHLMETWETDKEKVVIPTPVLSEFLVLAGSEASQYLDEIHASSHFIILPYDEKAAIELAAIQITNRAAMSKSAQPRALVETKAKLNFDRQIVAIAKANGIVTIYSDDKSVKTFAEQNGLSVIPTWTLPLPAAVKVPLPFTENEEGKTNETKAANTISTDVSGSSDGLVTDEARAAANDGE